MKRMISVVLALVLCLSVIPAFADSTSTITVNGDHNSVNVNTVDGCGNTAVINDGACGTVTPCKPSGTCVVINGVPCCIEPPDPCCSDPDYCARMRRHTCLKNGARDVFGYLEGRLRSIGWWHKNYKFVWSFETRVIYGSCGDNNHYRDRRPITFYFVNDRGIKTRAYLSAYKHNKEIWYVISTDFTPAKKCDKNAAYKYSDDIIISGPSTDGYAVIDDFIAYLQSLSGDAPVAEDDDVDTGCDDVGAGNG